MIVLAGLLVLVAGALLVGGLGNGETVMLWGSVGVSALAAAALVLQSVRRSRAARADAEDDEPALVGAAASAAGSAAATTPAAQTPGAQTPVATTPAAGSTVASPQAPAAVTAAAPAGPAPAPAAEEEPPAAVECPAAADAAPAAVTSPAAATSSAAETSPAAEAETVVTPAVVEATAAAAPAPTVVPTPVEAPPTVPGPSTGSHTHRPPATLDEDGEPVEEDVVVTDLLLVLDLTDEVEVVDEHPRYHLAGCRVTAGQEVFGLPLTEAKQDGFTACGICRPDRNLADVERRRRAAAKA